MQFLRTLLLGLILISPGCAAFHHQTTYRLDSSYSVEDPQFQQTIGNLLGPALIPGNQVATLLNGDQIFPAMLESIHSAKKSITLEIYIYWSGSIGKQFAAALAERAAAGVKVNLLIDWFGSAQIDNAHLETMKHAGVNVQKHHEFLFYDPVSYMQIDNRTHRKILVVDGRIGYTGGAGIADLWAGTAQDPNHWRDNHYRLQGPAVAQLQAAFAENWMLATGTVLDGDDYFPPLPPAGTQLAQVLKSSPVDGDQTMQLLMLLSISHAAKTICIESAYFVPDSQTSDALIKAARRGVNVEIIVPGGHIDEKIVRAASRTSWRSLLEAGIKIYEYQPTMLHCKLLVVDDLWTSIGSSNMDNRSFHINDEANLNILDRDFALSQVRMFEDDKSHSKPISLEDLRHRGPFGQITDGLAGFMKSEL